jgi:sugar (pentulose or hexulose) kinase
LCGRFVDAVPSQVGFLPFDFKRLEWARPSDPMWRALTVRRQQLPELVPPGRVLGEISAEAAAATGIPTGLPIVCAGADKACEVLGSGALEPDVAALSFGTTATMNVCSRRYVEAIKFLPPYPAALPGSWNVEQMVFRGYWMVEWWKREFAHREVAEAAALGVAPESLFERLLDETPPGAMGLTLQPYWSPGLRVPGPEGKGALIGFGDVHGRAHIYRAILEGLAYALREAKERVEGRTGTAIRSVRVAGGGARSTGALQITADVFGLPVERPHVHEASGLGAAINVAVGLGMHPNYETAVARMVHTGARVEPRPDVARIYDGLFREVYLPMYSRLAPLYRAIRRITGYPR